MKIRHNNAKAKENHLSIKDLPADLGKAKDELKSRIDSLGIDKNIVTKYQSQVDDLKNLKGDLKSLVERVNTDSDKLASGAHVISIKKGDEVEYLVQTEDEMLEQLEKVKETNEKIKQLNEEREQASKERKAEIDAEIANKEAERQESYKYASDLVNSTADAAVNFTKGVISGDPDRMVDVILGALAGIFSLLPKGIALGVTAVKSAWDKHKANEKLEDEDIKQLEQVQMDVVSEGAINSDPMTPEELEEVKSSYSDASFEDVGKITDWESAFKYGYAKLKQIHGVNFDESKAREVLEGLKAKYPDNPKVVIGALKYGGRRKKENVNKTEENNSRTLNSVPEGIYAVWEQMEEGYLLDVAYTGPFTSTEDAKSKLGFKYWTQEGGMKNRVTLVSKKYIPDFKFFVPVDEFIKDWNNALRGFSEVTSEILTHLNMRKINSKFSTAIHKCGDGVRCSGVHKLSYLINGFLDALSEDYSEEDVLGCLKGFMHHHMHGNQGGMHRGNNSVHNFNGSPNLTDDEKSEVSETIEEFWDESKPLESYIKVLNYLIKNWGINVKDIPTNQFKTIEDLMDWESKNFGQVPSLIGNIENYIATELADYVDQLPSQYNSRKSNSSSRDIHMEVKSAYGYLKSHLRYPKDLDCVIDKYSTPGGIAWCYLILIPKSNSNEDSQAAIKKVISDGLMDVTEDYSDKYPDYIVLSSDEMPQEEKPLVHVIRNSRQPNSMVPAKDTEIIDQYVAQANNDNYLDILKDIAKELGEHFDVRKDFGSPNEFRSWAEKNDKISDRMFIVLDYVLGAVTGMKSGVRKNSRSLNSNLLDVVSKSLPSDSTWNVEDNDGKITLSSGSRVLTIERTDDRYFLSDEKDVIYISSDLSKVIEEIKKLS